MHVHFFMEISIEESILHIHLIKRPTANSNHNNETSDRCKASNMSKCFLIVNRSINLGLDLVNPPTTYYRLTKRQINHIPSVILMKGI